jgi:hypothetical protein
MDQGVRALRFVIRHFGRELRRSFVLGSFLYRSGGCRHDVCNLEIEK